MPERAGVPGEILSLIKGVEDTCKACKAWTNPLPSAAFSVSLVSELNHVVEGDIQIYKMVNQNDKLVFELKQVYYGATKQYVTKRAPKEFHVLH